MSRIGKRPVTVPSGVTATVEGQTVKMKGPKGQLQFIVHDDVEVKFENGAVKVAPRVETNRARALYGTARAQVANLLAGVTKGFEKKLVRLSLRRTASGRPRLSVFRSSKHIYAQVIDDLKGETLASASSLEKAMRESGNTGANIDAAKAVGKLLAERAVKNGVTEVVFDRGGYLYHGRVKALADAARES